MELKQKEIELAQIESQRENDQENRENDLGQPWKERTSKQKLTFVLVHILKGVLFLSLLYCFIISLDLMSSAFRLIAGKSAAKVFQSEVMENPLAGLMIGVIVTVIVQSSSTSSSIIVSMVAAEIMPVKVAIPIIMGANIGTSVTGVLVALTQVAEKEKFRLSFAGATVHDMFNLLTVTVLLPTELVTSYLQRLSGVLVESLLSGNSRTSNPEMLNAITKPFTRLIIQLDAKVLENLALGKNDTEHLIKSCKDDSNSSTTTSSCNFLFANVEWAEWVIGLILLFVSLVILCSCLILMVKILGSIFKGPIAKVIQRAVNADFPGPFKYLTGYFAILIGCGMTILVQSSSVFTSSLVPLVGMGLVSIDRIFPLTLGSNIGTTVTGLLAALSSTATSKSLRYSLQIALCHTLFNVSGIVIWYPIPFIRQVPLFLAKSVGNISAEYRWFGIVYIATVFFIVPLSIFALSLTGMVVFLSIFVPIIILAVAIVVINVLQNKKPTILPNVLRTWEFLPLPLRSLKPYDKFLLKYVFVCKSLQKIEPSETVVADELDLVKVDAFAENNQLRYTQYDDYHSHDFEYTRF